MKFRSMVIAAAAMVLGLGASGALAGRTIAIIDPNSGKDSGWRADVQDGIDLTVFSVKNDLTSLSLEKLADFTEGPNEDGYIEPLRITFYQVLNTATRYIKIADEFVQNNTGVAWDGFTMKVESARMGPNGGPKLAPSMSGGFGLDGFSSMNFSEEDTRVTFAGGIIPTNNGQDLDHVWTPGLGDSGSLVIDADPFARGSVRQTFVFKEQPLFSETHAVPLPAAAWSALIGLAGIAAPGAMKKARRALA